MPLLMNFCLSQRWCSLPEPGGRETLGHSSTVALPSRRIAEQDHERPPARGGALEASRFFLEWLRDPIGTAAVAPSGRALASLITGGVGVETGAVLELGPGTGVFTQRLIERGIAESNLTLVEQNPTFARLLEQRYPHASILRIDAADLNRTPSAEAPAFGAAVCGLGLRNMDAAKIEAIMRAAFATMTPAASLYLFTYGWRCSVPYPVLDRLGLIAERVGTTLRNMPPASVYRISRHSFAE